MEEYSQIYNRTKIIYSNESNILKTNVYNLTMSLKLSLMDSLLFGDKGDKSNLIKKDDLTNLQIISNIGSGGFSEVYQVVDIDNNNEFALRLCLIEGRKFTYKRAIKEIEIFKQLSLINSDYIVKINSYKIINSENNLYLQCIMELGVCTLEEVLKKRIQIKKYWQEIEILKIIYMITKALSDAQKYGVSHRDLSLNNIILTKDLNSYKLIDFGEAKKLIDKTEELPIVGKIKYLSPELREIINQIQNGNLIKKNDKELYDVEKSDVFSFMIIILSICLLDPIDGRDVFQNDFKKKLEIVYNKYPRVKIILIAGLKINPSQRVRFNELLNIIDVWDKEINNYMYYEIEYDSKLKKINNIEKDNFDNIKQYQKYGDNCMKNNLYFEAMKNYSKIYEIIKREKNKNENHKNILFDISLKIAQCNKELLNFDETLNIYQNLYENEKKIITKTEVNEERFLFISYEYAYSLYIKYKCKESNIIISKSINYLKNKSVINKYLNYFLKLIELKGKIFTHFGNYFEARQVFINIKDMYNKYNDNLKTLSYKSLGCKINILNDYQSEINLLEIEINNSNFKNSEIELIKILNNLKKLFYNGENEMINRVLLLLIKLYHHKKKYILRDYKINELENIYKEYDQLRLIKNSNFMDFVCIKNIILSEEGHPKLALLRIDNIMKILLLQNNQFYLNQLKSIKSTILIKVMKLNDSMLILKENLKPHLDTKDKLQDYNNFIDVHIKMSDIYYLRGEIHKSYKCLKFLLQEYFLNDNFTVKIENLKLSELYMRLSQIYKKKNNLKNCLKYLDKAKSIIDKKLDDDKFNLNYLSLNKLYSRYYYEMNNNDLSLKFLDDSLLKIKHNYKNKYEETNEIIPLYRDYGNIYQKMGEYEKSLNFYKISLKLIKEKYGTQYNLHFSLSLNDMANLCLKFKKYDLSIKYYNKCLEINEIYSKEMECNNEIATNYFGLGNVYFNLLKYDEAIKYYYKSKEITDKLSNNNINLDSLQCEYQIAKIINKNDSIEALKLLKNIILNLKILFGKENNNHPIIKKIEITIYDIKNN